MNRIDTIVAIIALIGSLVLVTSGSRFRAMPHGGRARLAMIWVAIFVVLAWLAQASGLSLPHAGGHP